MRPRPIVLSWSGGKDSALTLAALASDETLRVVGLVTTVTRGYDRVSIHGVRRTLLHAQAASLGLPLDEVVIEPGCSNVDYERAFLDAISRARERYPGLAGIAFGDLFLADVREYRERLLEGSGLNPIFPLWGEPTAELAERCCALGVDARLVCVDTTQLSADFVGRRFDRALIAELPCTVDPCGERGEFHTFVANAPGFQQAISYTVGEIVRREERFVYCDLLPLEALAASSPTG